MVSFNPISWFQTEAPIIEADVLNFIKKVEQGVNTAVTDAENALTWVAQQTPAIAADLQTLEAFVFAVPGVAANPTVMAAITAANLAVQGLNAFATTFNQSTTPGQSVTVSQAASAVTAGYQAVKQAQIAAATAATTAVAATTTAASK